MGLFFGIGSFFIVNKFKIHHTMNGAYHAPIDNQILITMRNTHLTACSGFLGSVNTIRNNHDKTKNLPNATDRPNLHIIHIGAGSWPYWRAT